jgi:hypothetical protein
MRRILAIAALMSGSAQAQQFGAETSLIAHWQKPFGAASTASTPASMGFQLRTGPIVQGQTPLKSTVVDLRFGPQGFHSFSLNGIVLRQGEASGGAPASEINWWIVGGLVAGMTVVTYQQYRHERRRNQQPQCTLVFVGVPPAPVCI